MMIDDQLMVIIIQYKTRILFSILIYSKQEHQQVWVFSWSVLVVSYGFKSTGLSSSKRAPLKAVEKLDGRNVMEEIIWFNLQRITLLCHPALQRPFLPIVVSPKSYLQQLSLKMILMTLIPGKTSTSKLLDL
ncbi:hypothetical protein C5167_036429 [Papaver somniferum]|uniref:Uncharacterized protein n=1 Tax=Papaver somniferum TaxID=3469 RepID=A0A4Y7I7T9_PAPSO|nr:hypothetical protein C5167_036429 [Papaver somniferum]